MKLFNKIASIFESNTTETVELNSNIDQEIHDAVFSAQEELLKEAQAVLDNVKSDIELGKPQYPIEEELLLKKLLDLGFTNQPQVVELQAKLDVYKAKLDIYNKEQAKARSTAELVKYYNGKYKNKFITIDSIKSICNRFGLLFTPIEMYSAEIPLKNMREIADFKCDVEDKLYRTRFQISDDNFIDKYLSHKRERYTYTVEMEIFIPKFNEDKYRSKYDDHKEIAKFLNEKYKTDISWTRIDRARQDNHNNTRLTNGMMIAPKNKFTIPKDYVVENGFEVGYRKIVEIKDPVVLQPVAGGYLIVSAWGFESTLPEINSGSTEFSNN